MCGFAGIVAWDDRYHVARPTLDKMSARIAHRGPDGQGCWLNHEAQATPQRPQVGLVHRRLAILDLDPRANQPFTDGQGRWLVFNGEIYNFRELRAELAQLKPDYAWRTQCDTEVLLVAYAAWGEACVEHLNGMFAFAIWDESAGTLFLARDRMGQKPLYVAVANRDGSTCAVAFASEIPALLELPWVNPSISTRGLFEYLSLGYTLDSIYQGISQISAGSVSTITSRQLSHRSYFSPNVANSAQTDARRVPDDEAVGRTRELTLQAVRRQLVSDVPVGCFLSGGIDSSVIALAMKGALPRGQSPLTFSIGFDNPDYDETRYAAAVAQHLGTDHRVFTVRPEAARDLPTLAAAFGEPFGDSSALPTYYLSRQTRQHVKTCLSGDGGDELFGGYDRYRAMRWASRLRNVLPSLTLNTMHEFASRAGGSPKSTSARIRRFLGSLNLTDDRRYERYMLLDGREQNDLFDPEQARACGWQGPWTGAAFRLQQNAGLDAVRAALATDRQIYLPHDLLTKVDRCSMQFALEVRSPFMDHELVRFAAGLTTDQLLRGGPKRMLREAFAADLPAFVFKRKKMGFAVPIGQWFRGELRGMLRENLFAADSFASKHLVRRTVERLVEEHEQQRVDHSQRLYAMLMLELWWRNIK